MLWLSGVQFQCIRIGSAAPLWLLQKIECSMFLLLPNETKLQFATRIQHVEVPGGYSFYLVHLQTNNKQRDYTTVLRPPFIWILSEKPPQYMLYHLWNFRVDSYNFRSFRIVTARRPCWQLDTIPKKSFGHLATMLYCGESISVRCDHSECIYSNDSRWKLVPENNRPSGGLWDSSFLFSNE